MNIELAEKVIANLNRSGVNEFVVCAGGRNAPLVKLLGVSEGARIHYFYDERAAGFFALGRVRCTGSPVAVVTTSGTAAAELLPAAIEAHYSGFPLVLVTADRPLHYRGSGAPQTIEQVGLYSYYTRRTLDLTNPEDVPELFSFRQSLHLNLCFSEPLLDQKIPIMKLKIQAPTARERRSSVYNENVAAFFKTATKPLVILGALRASVRGRMLEFLANLNAPVVAEAQSGLRECEKILPLILKAGEGDLSADFVGREFDSILRIGSVPTIRLWRDLDLGLSKLPVLSVGDAEFSGLAREIRTAATFSDLFTAGAGSHFESRPELLSADTKKFAEVENLLAKYPAAETSYFRRLSQNISDDDLIFVGNSLPIREWDFAADYKRPHATVLANRGANGIDGLIATFMGLAEPKRGNWIILGDLSALYDLNALSFAEPNMRLRIVVVNNHGGHIFTDMFGDKNFLNQHNLNFSKWAEMFNFDYVQTDLIRPLGELAERVVIELNPDNDESEKFWADYRKAAR